MLAFPRLLRVDSKLDVTQKSLLFGSIEARSEQSRRRTGPLPHPLDAIVAFQLQRLRLDPFLLNANADIFVLVVVAFIFRNISTLQ